MHQDNFVLDVVCAIVESSYECIPLSSGKHENGSDSKHRLLPEWNNVIAPLKKDSLFGTLSGYRLAGLGEAAYTKLCVIRGASTIGQSKSLRNPLKT